MIRITGGKYKGRLISMPGMIRPTQNKVRKAIFDILGDITGLSFLELFAGSAAVGFEALSRGAGEVYLVEAGRTPLSAIKRNALSLEAENLQIYPKDSMKAIKDLSGQGRRFDIVFMDPPYSLGLSKKALQAMSMYDILAPSGLAIVEHFKKDDLPEQLGVLHLFRQSVYGDTILSFYNKGPLSEP